MDWRYSVRDEVLRISEKIATGCRGWETRTYKCGWTNPDEEYSVYEKGSLCIFWYKGEKDFSPNGSVDIILDGEFISISMSEQSLIANALVSLENSLTNIKSFDTIVGISKVLSEVNKW